MISKTRAALLASALLAMPAAALAQNEVTDQAEAVADTANQLEQEANTLGNVVTEEAAEGTDRAGGADRGDGRGDRDDGDSGKWGLLGLLGLAGLLGLKRRDDHDHRDHRGTSTGTTGTRTGTGPGPGTGTDNRL